MPIRPPVEVSFFIAERSDAMRVGIRGGLTHDLAAEPLPIPSLEALHALGSALPGDLSKRALRPLRDATCRSFPVWEWSQRAMAALAGLDEAGCDRVAEAWLADPAACDLECDLYELTEFLAELANALRDRHPPQAGLFALLEERAI